MPHSYFHTPENFFKKAKNMYTIPHNCGRGDTTALTMVPHSYFHTPDIFLKAKKIYNCGRGETPAQYHASQFKKKKKKYLQYPDPPGAIFSSPPAVV